MTAPIQEPTPNRDVSGLGYGQRQLYRRPPPTGGEHTIPGFHAWMTHDITLATANDEQISWDFWINDDDTIFDATSITGGDAFDITLLVDGWYSIQVWIDFTSDPASGFAGIEMIHDDSDYQGVAQIQGVTFPHSFSLGGGIQFATVMYFPAVFLTQEPPTFSWADRLEFWAIQNSGVNRTVTQAHCVIGYLGPRQTGTETS